MHDRNALTTHATKTCDQEAHTASDAGDGSDAFDFAALARQQVRGCRAAYGSMLQGWAQDVLTLRSRGIQTPCWIASSAQEPSQPAPVTKSARQHRPGLRAAGHQRAA